MRTTPNDTLQRLLLEEIETNARKRDRLRRDLQKLEPQLRRAVAYYKDRFGEASLPAALRSRDTQRKDVGPRKDTERTTIADRAAEAVKQAGKVGVPLQVRAIYECMQSTGFVVDGKPSEATVGTLVAQNASAEGALFERTKRGWYRLNHPTVSDESASGS